ncbi:hypothetical protein [Rhodovulum kholense]|uniref:Lipoprotein n=1 Tax=Rhodovulum kholense TaxID=453584 RepID=A0A8E2VLD2_9RHOB|nr:hypothetical protein [Rhodovulum kholense]PTW49662.1 hypothetical protein C8N38_107184 [Rhodovulum kholense]
MVGPTKTLTVSYGTFSCKLEGFEDSFGMMKAVTEYFRDLAAEDRYFGAEPPPPDAETLQRIAEREVRRRVEARVELDGVVLRSGESPVAGAAQVSHAAPAPSKVLPPRADEPESVAAKLARIRAAVETAHATDAELAGPDFEDETDDLAAPAQGPQRPFVRPPEHPADPGRAASPLRQKAGPESDTGVAARHSHRPDAPARASAAEDRPHTAAASGPELRRCPEDRGPAANAASRTVPETAEASAAPARPQQARARVLKLRRDDLTDAWPDTPERPLAPPADPDARLPESDEADLQAELAALQADGAPVRLADPSPGPHPASGDAVPARQGPAERTRSADLADHELALQRLLDETNTKLAGPEQKRRQASIAHLKAAVAATVAERRIGNRLRRDDDGPTRPYRQALAEVVRGDRETSADGDRGRLAPLILVTEQRIDEPKEIARSETAAPAESSATLRLDTPVLPATETRLRAFAADLGAHDPTDLAGLLEAGAAYLMRQEGVAYFTRPQVIELARSIAGDGFQREDMLRAFGIHLRDGRFRRLRRGQFVMDDVAGGREDRSANRIA